MTMNELLINNRLVSATMKHVILGIALFFLRNLAQAPALVMTQK